MKSLIANYIERVWNQADFAALDAMTTPDFVYYLGGQPARNRAGMRQFVEMVHAAFPDWRVKIAQCVADETTVAARWQGEATHRGPFQGIPPTGKRIAVSGINMYQISAGLIVAEWEQTDSLGSHRKITSAFGLQRFTLNGLCNLVWVRSGENGWACSE